MTTCGSRSSGSPDDLDVRHPRRRPADPFHQVARRALLGVVLRLGLLPGLCGGEDEGTHGARVSDRCSASRRGPGRPHRVRCARRGGRAAGRPRRRRPRRARRRRGRVSASVSRPRDAVASRSSGTPASRHAPPPRRRAAACPPHRSRSGGPRRPRPRRRAPRHTRSGPPARSWSDPDGGLGARLEEYDRALRGARHRPGCRCGDGRAQGPSGRARGHSRRWRARTPRRAVPPARRRAPPARCRAAREPDAPEGGGGSGRPSRPRPRRPGCRRRRGCSGPRAASSRPVAWRSGEGLATVRR